MYPTSIAFAVLIEGLIISHQREYYWPVQHLSLPPAILAPVCEDCSFSARGAAVFGLSAAMGGNARTVDVSHLGVPDCRQQRRSQLRRNLPSVVCGVLRPRQRCQDLHLYVLRTMHDDRRARDGRVLHSKPVVPVVRVQRSQQFRSRQKSKWTSPLPQ